MIKFYTSIPKNNIPEGAGAIYQGELIAYLVCLLNNKKLLRTRRVLDIKHEPDDFAKNLAVKEWDTLMGFLGPVHEITEIGNSFNLNEVENLELNQGLKILENINTTTWSLLVNKIRTNFYVHNQEIINSRVKSSFRVAVHIRNLSAGDVCLGKESLPWQLFNFDYGRPNQNPKFYSKLYAGLILKMFGEFNQRDEPIQIHIFSTGDSSSFDYFIELLNDNGFKNVSLFLNRPSYVDFVDLVTSDSLIMAQSSFSYIAALLSPSKKFIRNSFRLKLPSDVVIFKDYLAIDYSLYGKAYSFINDFIRIVKKFK